MKILNPNIKKEEKDRAELLEEINKKIINVRFGGLDSLNFKPRAVVKKLRELQREKLALVIKNKLK